MTIPKIVKREEIIMLGRIESLEDEIARLRAELAATIEDRAGIEQQRNALAVDNREIFGALKSSRAELTAAQSDLSAEKSSSRAAISVLNDVRAELGLEDGYSVVEKVIELRMEHDAIRQQDAEAGAREMQNLAYDACGYDVVLDIDPAAVARAALQTLDRERKMDVGERERETIS